MARLKSAVPDYLGAPIESLPRRYWEVLFPRSEWTLIAQAARSRRLDANLMCGLILQESAFNPLAVSQAGAMGLMQVLPGTGSDAARVLGDKGFRPSRLLEPAVNIRMGTWHFSELLGRQGGSIELALAAYNAGEARVRGWRSVFGTSEPAYFVEEVPYSETRLYVKRILSHAAMYRAIYGP
jgi:soluble lytic murein transglycosylase